MKNILVTLFLFSATTSYAQSEYNYENTWTQRRNSAIVFNVPGVKNKEVDIVTKNVKRNKEWHFKKQYDRNGKLIKYSKFSKGEEIVLNENFYDDEGGVLNTREFKKTGKLKEELKIERNQEGKQVKSEKFKNGKKVSTKVWNYRPAGCVEMSTMHKANGDLKYKWMYEYYTECDKKRSVLLKPNGKVKKEWTYDCKQEGEQLEKKKDMTQICKWEELDGNYIVKVYQSLNDKGETYKMVSTFRSSDTAIVKVESYNGKEELERVYTYDFSYERPLTHKSFKKGKVKYETVYTYENGNIASYTSKRNSKVIYNSTYEYNEDNLLTEMKSFGKGGELSRITAVNYN